MKLASLCCASIDHYVPTNSITLPIIITPVPNTERRSSAGDLPLPEFDINQSRFSSSSYTLPTQARRVRFHTHHSVRRRSSTFTELPTCADCHKPIFIASDGNDHQQGKNVEHFQKSSRLSSHQKDKPSVNSRQTKTAIVSAFPRKTQRSIPRSVHQSSTKFRLEDFDFRRKRIAARVENDSFHQ